MELWKLSERRQADRSKMATLIEALVVECGASCTREAGGTYPGPNVIHVDVKGARGLEVTVALDGKSCQPDVHVLSWHMDLQSSARLDNATFGGSVNRYHQRKATYVAYGFTDLHQQLKRALLLAKDGTAFLPEPEALAA